MDKYLVEYHIELDLFVRVMAHVRAGEKIQAIRELNGAPVSLGLKASKLAIDALMNWRTECVYHPSTNKVIVPVVVP
jgi:hypothetical protein